MLTQNFKKFVMFLLVSLQVFSSVLFVPFIEEYGGSLFRVVLVILSIYFILYSGFKAIDIVVKRAIYVCAFLTVWMIGSLFLSYDFRLGFQQISYVVNIALLIYVLDSMVKSNNDMQFLAKCIVFVGLIVTTFSLYELWTGIHFFDSQILIISESSASLAYAAENSAWFTFSNPNDLGVHLIFCAMVSFIIIKNKFNFAYYIFCFSFMSYLTIEVESRLALLSMIVFLTLYFLCIRQKKSKLIFLTAFSANFVGFILVISSLIYADTMEFIDVSTYVRLQLMLSAADTAAKSLFFGVGVGNFETMMQSNGWSAVTYGMVNPHNAMGRIFAENGIIGLLLLGFLIFGPIAIGMGALQPTRTLKFLVAFVTALPLLFSVGSDPLSSSTLQLAIAISWVICRLAVTNPLDLRRALTAPVQPGGSSDEQNMRPTGRSGPLQLEYRGR